VREAALAALGRASSTTLALETPAGAAVVFLEVFPRQPRLVVFGGVHIAVALVPLARMLGYRTIVADGRASFLTRDRATHVVLPRAEAEEWIVGLRSYNDDVMFDYMPPALRELLGD
jgi:xanthine dehydrogenase accessory factor